MKAISYPFRVSPQGRIADTTDTTRIWVDRVRAVVNTAIGDRVMRPSFGVDTVSAILNLGTPAASDLKANITSAFASQLPSVTLNSIKTNIDDVNQTVEVEVVFTCPDRTISTTSVTLSSGIVTSETEPYGVPQL